MDTSVAEDAKILGGGDGKAGLIEGAELYGVAVEWGFEYRHCGGGGSGGGGGGFCRDSKDLGVWGMI